MAVAAHTPPALTAAWRFGFLFTRIIMFGRGVASLGTAEGEKLSDHLAILQLICVLLPAAMSIQANLATGAHGNGEAVPTTTLLLLGGYVPVLSPYLNTVWG